MGLTGCLCIGWVGGGRLGWVFIVCCKLRQISYSGCGRNFYFFNHKMWSERASRHSSNLEFKFMQVKAILVHHMASSQILFRSIVCHGILLLFAVIGHCAYSIGSRMDVMCLFCCGNDLKQKMRKVDYFGGKAKKEQVETIADIPNNICSSNEMKVRHKNQHAGNARPLHILTFYTPDCSVCSYLVEELNSSVLKNNCGELCLMGQIFKINLAVVRYS